MEPIEIELRMKQNLEEESKKAQQSVDKLSDASQKSQDNLRKSIAAQKKLIAELKKEIQQLKDAFAKLDVDSSAPKANVERKKLIDTTKEMTQELVNEEQALNNVEKTVEKTTAKMVSLRTQMSDVKNQMYALTQAGKENSEEYQQLTERLGELGVEYRKLKYIEESVSTAGTQLGGFMDGLNILSGAISAGSGALALFNQDSEKLAKIQTQLQKVMTISIGLMQVSNTLHSTSAFRISTVTKAQQLWSTANVRLATTLGISTAATKAFMIALTGGLSIAVTAVVAVLSRLISKQREVAAENKRLKEAVADATAGQLESFNKLRISYRELDGNINAQNELLEKNRDKFDELGIAVNSVNEAERMFNDEGTKAFRTAVLERAKAIATMDLAATKYKSIVTKSLQYDEMDDKEEVGPRARGVTDKKIMIDNQRKIALGKEIEKEQKEWEDLIKRADAYQKQADEFFNSHGNADGKGGDKDIVEDTRAYWLAQKKAAEDRLDAMKFSEAGSKEWQKYIADIKKAEEKLKIWSVAELVEATDGEKERAELARFYKEIEDSAQKARISAMEEGVEKTLAQNELGHKERLEAIERQKSELLKAMQELEEATWLSQGGKGKFKHTITELPREINEAFITQTEASLKQLQQANEEAINKLISSIEPSKKDTSAVLGSIVAVQKEKLDSVATYERLQLRALASEEQKLDAETYAKRKALIEKNAQDARDAIAQEAEESLKLIPKDMLDSLFSDFDLSFMNLNAATLGQLNEVADKLQKLKLDKSELITLGLSEAQIEMLQSLLEDIKSESVSNVQTAKIAKMQEAFSEIGAIISKSSDETTQAVGNMVTATSSMIGTLSDPNASGFSKATSLISLSITVAQELDKMMEAWGNRALEKQREFNNALAHQLTLEAEINRMRRERAEIERNSSVFLKPDFKVEYKAQLDNFKEADETMNKALAGLMGNAIFTTEGKAKRALFGTKKGDYSFTMEQLLGDYDVDIKGSDITDMFKLGGYFNIVKEGSWLDPFGLFGTKAGSKAKNNALGNLRTAFDETFKAMGKTSADIANMSAQEWVDFYSLMEEGGYVTDEGTKKLIATAKQASEEYAEAMQKMKEIISDVAGSLGGQLANDLVSAFRAGEDAAQAFKKSVNEVLQQMFMQQIQTAFFQKHFDKLQADMEKSMDGGDGNWEDDLMRFFNDIEPSIGKAQKAMEYWDKKMTEAGYGGFKGEDEDSRTAQTKGLAQASQESIDELNGRIMAISGNVYKIQEGNSQMLSLKKESLLITKTITAQLDVIANNTSYCKFLVDIDSTLEDIKTKGVKIR